MERHEILKSINFYLDRERKLVELYGELESLIPESEDHELFEILRLMRSKANGN
jgi:hypothetical protein